jgi:hypothetical protein
MSTIVDRTCIFNVQQSACSVCLLYVCFVELCSRTSGQKTQDNQIIYFQEQNTKRSIITYKINIFL